MRWRNWAMNIAKRSLIQFFFQKEKVPEPKSLSNLKLLMIDSIIFKKLWNLSFLDDSYQIKILKKYYGFSEISDTDLHAFKISLLSALS